MVLSRVVSNLSVNNVAWFASHGVSKSSRDSQEGSPPRTLTLHELCFVPLPTPLSFCICLLVLLMFVCACATDTTWLVLAICLRQAFMAVKRHHDGNNTYEAWLNRGWLTVQRFRDLSSRQEARQCASRRGARVSQGVYIWIQRQQQERRCH